MVGGGDPPQQHGISAEERGEPVGPPSPASAVDRIILIVVYLCLLLLSICVRGAVDADRCKSTVYCVPLIYDVFCFCGDGT